MHRTRTGHGRGGTGRKVFLDRQDRGQGAGLGALDIQYMAACMARLRGGGIAVLIFGDAGELGLCCVCVMIG
jgi:hypothetical protein